MKVARKNIIQFECVKKFVLNAFGVENFLPEQENAVLDFSKAQNIFFVAPTGYGKSLIFQVTPYLVDFFKFDKVYHHF